MSEKIDSGAILAVDRFGVLPSDNVKTLVTRTHDALGNLAMRIWEPCFPWIDQVNARSSRPSEQNSGLGKLNPWRNLTGSGESPSISPDRTCRIGFEQCTTPRSRSMSRLLGITSTSTTPSGQQGPSGFSLTARPQSSFNSNVRDCRQKILLMQVLQRDFDSHFGTLGLERVPID
jgi:hypothetical protein